MKTNILISYLLEFEPYLKESNLTKEQKEEVSRLIIEAMKIIDKEYMDIKWLQYILEKNK